MSKIYFKHLSMTNFMSYKQAEIDLNRSGNILVGGMNQNPEDNAKSNGCGKSTIFSALSWALTGETISGAKDVKNIYSEGKTEVSITFDIDENSYKIIRSKGPSNLQLFINDKNVSGKGVRDTEQVISKYLPRLHSSLLNSVIILGQGLPQKFTNNTPAGRKAVLETLAETDFMIVDLRYKLEARKTELQKKKREHEDFRLEWNNTKSILEGQLKEKTENLAYLEDEATLERAIIDLEAELEKLLNQKTSTEADKETLDNILSEKRIDKDKAFEALNNELASLQKEDTSDLEKVLIEKKSELGAVVEKIVEYENITDTCPTCGQKLPDVHKIDTTDLRKHGKELEVEINNTEATIYDIKHKNNEIENRCKEKYNTQIQELNSKISDLEKDSKQKDAEIKKLSNDVHQTEQQINSIKTRKATLEVTKQTLEKEIKEREEAIKIHEEKLYKNDEELGIINNRLAINSKMLTLIQRDFRGHLLNNVISFIENKAKEYSLSVFGTDKLSFKLEKNNIDISYDGKDYSCLSGGEKQKLDIIIQFAIRDMLVSFRDFSSNILVLDEITDALDAVGVNRVFNLINENLTDVEAVYIISHHVDELEIPADDEIIIIKGDDKISRII